MASAHPFIPRDRDLYLCVPYEERREAAELGAEFDYIKRSWYVPAGADPEPLREWFRVYLTCPIEEKDEAKALGAKYDPDEQDWFVPAKYIGKFKKWHHRPSVRKFFRDRAARAARVDSPPVTGALPIHDPDPAWALSRSTNHVTSLPVLKQRRLRGYCPEWLDHGACPGEEFGYLCKHQHSFPDFWTEADMDAHFARAKRYAAATNGPLPRGKRQPCHQPHKCAACATGNAKGGTDFNDEEVQVVSHKRRARDSEFEAICEVRLPSIAWRDDYVASLSKGEQRRVKEHCPFWVDHGACPYQVCGELCVRGVHSYPEFWSEADMKAHLKRAKRFHRAMLARKHGSKRQRSGQPQECAAPAAKRQAC